MYASVSLHRTPKKKTEYKITYYITIIYQCAFDLSLWCPTIFLVDAKCYGSFLHWLVLYLQRLLLLIHWCFIFVVSMFYFKFKYRCTIHTHAHTHTIRYNVTLFFLEISNVWWALYVFFFVTKLNTHWTFFLTRTHTRAMQKNWYDCRSWSTQACAIWWTGKSPYPTIRTWLTYFVRGVVAMGHRLGEEGKNRSKRKEIQRHKMLAKSTGMSFCVLNNRE